MGSLATLGNQLYNGQRSLPFIGRRKLWYGIAVAATAISLLALVFRGLTPSIEFSGGSEFTVTKVSNTSQSVAVDAVRTVVPDAEVRFAVVGGKDVRAQVDHLSANQTEDVKQALAEAYNVSSDEVRSVFVGPSWGEDVSKKAIQGLVVFLILVSILIGLYFRTAKMAVAAIVALIHDLLLTVGVYALVGFEVSPATVIGFLTILGYSLYDTVVVFDKVRENTEHITTSTKRTYAEAANLAVNQTLVRSINTSVVALLPVASILFIGAYVLGAGTLKDISLALFVGIAAGTYSSIFIATPLLVDLRRREPELVAQEARVLRRREQATEGDEREVLAGAGAGAEKVVLREASGGQRSQPRRPGRGRPAGKKN